MNTEHVSALLSIADSILFQTWCDVAQELHLSKKAQVSKGYAIFKAVMKLPVCVVLIDIEKCVMMLWKLCRYFRFTPRIQSNPFSVWIFAAIHSHYMLLICSAKYSYSCNSKWMLEKNKVHFAAYMDFILPSMLVFLDKLFELFILTTAWSLTEIQRVRIHVLKLISKKTMRLEEWCRG